MTWPEFLVCFVIASAGVTYLKRSLFRGRWLRLTQSCLLLTTVCFLLDYPAETRELWSFSNTTGITLYDTPVETHIFNATCFLDLLTVYLSLKNRREYTTRATPIARPPA